MYIKIEVDSLSEMMERIELGWEASDILEKVFEAELEDQAEEQIELRFRGQTPEDWELDEYICEQLLDDMGIDDIDEVIDSMREEGE